MEEEVHNPYNKFLLTKDSLESHVHQRIETLRSEKFSVACQVAVNTDFSNANKFTYREEFI